MSLLVKLQLFYSVFLHNQESKKISNNLIIFHWKLKKSAKVKCQLSQGSTISNVPCKPLQETYHICILSIVWLNTMSSSAIWVSIRISYHPHDFCLDLYGLWIVYLKTLITTCHFAKMKLLHMCTWPQFFLSLSYLDLECGLEQNGPSFQ